MPNQTLVLNPDQLEVLSLRVRAMPCLPANPKHGTRSAGESEQSLPLDLSRGPSTCAASERTSKLNRRVCTALNEIVGAEVPLAERASAASPGSEP